MDVVHVGFAPHFVDYEQAWEMQRQTHAAVVSGAAPDTVLLMEHAPVYTAGKRTEPHERPKDGTAVVDVDRGGKITWHGPGQVTGYPIVRLPAPIDVVAYVRALEEMMIRVCADFGIRAGRVDGQSGTWIHADESGPDRKIGAIGIRVSRQVAMHGFAFNANPDLAWGQVIIPCGIVGAGVTSLSAELGRDVPVPEVLPHIERHLADVVADLRPNRRVPDPDAARVAG
ncbi:MAG: lipoyl(octanoyl) transferase LipB [Actinomycetales bacterium]|nr:lipoyl(octanoyl) transferase LipB [Actinomycetales bacterium]